MSRVKLFKEADLARALRVVKAAGVEIGTVKIDASGGIVIESRSPSRGGETVDEVQAELDALDRRNAERRAARAASRAGQAAR